ncbi:MAG: methylenetetrahydrofolate reductase C-terminal domain-containing protein [Methanobacteriota archaeon]
MIVTKGKPMEELLEIIKPYKKVAIMGCGGCATVYETGGRRQVSKLASKLGNVVVSGVIPRLCSIEMVKTKMPREIEGTAAIIVLSCGIGVQTVAEFLSEKVVIPGLDTFFMGRREDNFFVEFCLGCGNCILHTTGGICPIARCPKSMLNGPCGGVYNGKCETDRTRDCAWMLIYSKLKSQTKLHLIRSAAAPKDFIKIAHTRKIGGAK